MDDFNKKQSQILAPIPFEFHYVLAALAWEEGHSFGENEVLNILENLVSQFVKPIRDFERRLTSWD